jgi:hypothetical protein
LENKRILCYWIRTASQFDNRNDPYNTAYGYIVDAGQIIYPKYSLVTDPAFKELFVKPELNKTFEVGTELRLLKTV